ncbi:MAG: hypothetical protein ACXACR_02005, partial [Candidatus Hodarchaeales archaeon]
MESKNENTAKKVLNFKNFTIGLVLGILVYLILIFLSNWEQLFDLLINVPIFVVLIALMLSFTNYIFRFFKWLLFTKSLNLTIPLSYNFKIF